MATRVTRPLARPLAVAAFLAATATAQAAVLERTRDVRGALPTAGATARVTLWHKDTREHSLSPIADGVAAADGTFAFDAVPWPGERAWGAHGVIAIARWTGHVAMREIRTDQTTLDPLELTTLATTTLTGTVRDDAGEPVAGATVWPRILGGVDQTATAWVVWPVAPLPHWRARTDAQGRFAIEGVPAVDRLWLHVEHSDLTYVNAQVDDLARPIDVTLPEGCALSGSVSMPDGSPARQVDVRASGAMSGWGRTVTDADGNFTLRGLPADTYKLWAEAADLTVIAIPGIELEPGDREDDLEIRLVHGGFIVGRLVDLATGAPITPGPRTDIAMYGPARPRGGACECTPVLPDGTFRIRAPAGANDIYLRGLGGASASRTVDVVDGEATEVVLRVRTQPDRR